MISRVLVWVALSLLLPCAISGADDVSANPLVVRLQPTDRFWALKPAETSRTFMTYVPIDVKHTDFVFKAEPAYASKDVIRGALYSRVRKDGSKDAVNFAWDRRAGTLYIDSNRDMDLTNDPEGVFRTSSRGVSQLFQDCPLVIEHDGVRVCYHADFDFYGTAWASARLVSGWRGNLELHGKKYCLDVQDGFTGAIDADANARLVIQSLDSPNLAFSGSAQSGSFPKDGHVVLDGQEYAFAFALKGSYMEATITEVARPMGDLRIEGQSVKFVILDGPARVVIDDPAQNVRVPLGSYRVRNIYLYDADAGDSYYATKCPTENVVIAEDHPAVLRVGGPLRMNVVSTRSVGILSLDLKIAGIGGEEYIPSDSSKHPAKFSVFSGDRKYFQGSFAYG